MSIKGVLLDLIAKDNNIDRQLIDNPEITFFKKVYKRHTNFSDEYIDLPVIGNVNFGGEFTCKIRNIGDLLSKIKLCFDLPYLEYDKKIPDNIDELIKKYNYDTYIMHKQELMFIKKIHNDINKYYLKFKNIIDLIDKLSYCDTEDKFIKAIIDIFNVNTNISSYNESNLILFYNYINNSNFIDGQKIFITPEYIIDKLYKYVFNIIIKFPNLELIHIISNLLKQEDTNSDNINKLDIKKYIKIKNIINLNYKHTINTDIFNYYLKNPNIYKLNYKLNYKLDVDTENKITNSSFIIDIYLYNIIVFSNLIFLFDVNYFYDKINFHVFFEDHNKNKIDNVLNFINTYNPYISRYIENFMTNNFLNTQNSYNFNMILNNKKITESQYNIVYVNLINNFTKLKINLHNSFANVIKNNKLFNNAINLNLYLNNSKDCDLLFLFNYTDYNEYNEIFKIDLNIENYKGNLCNIYYVYESYLFHLFILIIKNMLDDFNDFNFNDFNYSNIYENNSNISEIYKNKFIEKYNIIQFESNENKNNVTQIYNIFLDLHIRCKKKLDNILNGINLKKSSDYNFKYFLYNDFTDFNLNDILNIYLTEIKLICNNLIKTNINIEAKIKYVFDKLINNVNDYLELNKNNKYFASNDLSPQLSLSNYNTIYNEIENYYDCVKKLNLEFTNKYLEFIIQSLNYQKQNCSEFLSKLIKNENINDINILFSQDTSQIISCLKNNMFFTNKTDFYNRDIKINIGVDLYKIDNVYLDKYIAKLLEDDLSIYNNYVDNLNILTDIYEFDVEKYNKSLNIVEDIVNDYNAIVNKKYNNEYIIVDCAQLGIGLNFTFKKYFNNILEYCKNNFNNQMKNNNLENSKINKIINDSLLEINKNPKNNNCVNNLFKNIINKVIFKIVDIDFKTLLISNNNFKNNRTEIYDLLEINLQNIIKILTDLNYILETVKTNTVKELGNLDEINKAELMNLLNQSLPYVDINYFEQFNKIKYGWINNIGYNLIHSIECYNGSQYITGVTGEMLYLYNNLSKDHNDRGCKYLVGNTPDLYNLNSEIKMGRTLYIDIPFFFTEYNYLEISAMQYSDLYLKVKLNNFDHVFKTNYENGIFIKKYTKNMEKIYSNITPKLNSHIMCKYTYIDDHERIHNLSNKFTCLYDTFNTISDLFIDKNTIKKYDITNNNYYKINANTLRDPTKLIIITIKTKEDYENKSYFKFKTDRNLINKIDMILDDISRFSIKDSNYFNAITFNESDYYQTLGNNIYLIPFCIYHKMRYQPSGYINLSMFNNIIFNLYLDKHLQDKINIGSTYAVINIHTISYNVLHRMSGMVGKLFI